MKKRNKYVLVTLLVIVSCSVIMILLKNNKKVMCTDTDKTNGVKDIYVDNLAFLTKIQTENKICAYNSKINLYRCNNILEEKYDSNNNLTYIKTKEKEYFYDYIYDELNRIKVMTLDNNVLKFEYDNYNRVKRIDLLNNKDTIRVDYEYIIIGEDPYIDGTYYIPKKISVFTNKELNYSYTYERDVENIKIIETKFNNNNEKIGTKTFHSFLNYQPKVFQMINYIPEPYYENNISFNLSYQFINHGDTINNFIFYQEEYDEINGINIYKEEAFYNDSKDFFIKYRDYSMHTNNKIDFVAYKNENKYYKYNIEEKKYNDDFYLEILNAIEITETEFNELFQGC